MFSAATGRLMAVATSWHPGIGDPDALAWCIVGAYAVAVGAAVWAFVAARRSRGMLASVAPQESSNERLLARVWLIIAGVMLVLGVNKQLDLQTWLVQTLRSRAYRGGWYEERRRYQVGFIAFVVAAGLATTGMLAYLLRRVLSRVRVAAFGLLTLVLFVTIRAASFHHVDRFLASGGNVNINVILELTGIALVVAGAVRWRRCERARLEAMRHRPPPRRTGAWPRPEPAPTATVT